MYFWGVYYKNPQIVRENDLLVVIYRNTPGYHWLQCGTNFGSEKHLLCKKPELVKNQLYRIVQNPPIRQENNAI